MDLVYKIRNKSTGKFYKKSVSESGLEGSTKGGDVYVSPSYAEKRIEKLKKFHNIEWEIVKFKLIEIND